MKFAVVIVLFAMAFGAQSSVIHHPLVVAGVHPGSVAVHASAVPIAYHALHDVHAVHGVLPVQVVNHPVVVAPAVVSVVPAEATYVAKTLGAVHVAPLPGHANSAASVNLEPAPGTV